MKDQEIGLAEFPLRPRQEECSRLIREILVQASNAIGLVNRRFQVAHKAAMAHWEICEDRRLPELIAGDNEIPRDVRSWYWEFEFACWHILIVDPECDGSDIADMNQTWPMQDRDYQRGELEMLFPQLYDWEHHLLWRAELEAQYVRKHCLTAIVLLGACYQFPNLCCPDDNDCKFNEDCYCIESVDGDFGDWRFSKFNSDFRRKFSSVFGVEECDFTS